MPFDQLQCVIAQYAELLDIPPKQLKGYVRLDNGRILFNDSEIQQFNTFIKKNLKRSRERFVLRGCQGSNKSGYRPLDRSFDHRKFIRREKGDKYDILPIFTQENYIAQFQPPPKIPEKTTMDKNKSKTSKSKKRAEAAADRTTKVTGKKAKAQKPKSVVARLGILRAAASVAHAVSPRSIIRPPSPISAAPVEQEFGVPALLQQNEIVDGIFCHFRLRLRCGKNGVGTTGPPFELDYLHVPRGSKKGGYLRDISILIVPVLLELIDLNIQLPAMIALDGKAIIFHLPAGKQSKVALLGQFEDQLTNDKARLGTNHEGTRMALQALSANIESAGLSYTTICADLPEGITVTAEHFQDASAKLPDGTQGLSAEVAILSSPVTSLYGPNKQQISGWAFVLHNLNQEDNLNKEKTLPMDPAALLIQKNLERLHHRQRNLSSGSESSSDGEGGFSDYNSSDGELSALNKMFA